MNESTVLVEEGYLRRVFCQALEGRSPLEIIRNYEQAIKDKGGAILFVTRKPQNIVID